MALPIAFNEPDVRNAFRQNWNCIMPSMMQEDTGDRFAAEGPSSKDGYILL
jgi:hypothetical protein